MKDEDMFGANIESLKGKTTKKSLTKLKEITPMFPPPSSSTTKK